MESVGILRNQQVETGSLVSALSKQAADRPPIDPHRVTAIEMNVGAQDKAIHGMEQGIDGLWNKLSQIESHWESSTADGFRRLTTELHQDKEAFNQGLQDLRSVVSILLSFWLGRLCTYPM